MAKRISNQDKPRKASHRFVWAAFDFAVGVPAPAGGDGPADPPGPPGLIGPPGPAHPAGGAARGAAPDAERRRLLPDGVPLEDDY